MSMNRSGVLFLLLLIAIMTAHLVMHLTLVNRDPTPTPYRPLCLQPTRSLSSLLVAVPLLETEERAAVRALAARLERLTRHLPCRHVPAWQQPTIVVTTSLSAVAAITRLNRTLQDGIRPAAACFAAVETRAVADLRAQWSLSSGERNANGGGRHSGGGSGGSGDSGGSGGRGGGEGGLEDPQDETARANAAFAGAFGLAHSRRSPLLWLAPETTPLRGRWLEAVQCEAMDSSGA